MTVKTLQHASLETLHEMFDDALRDGFAPTLAVVFMSIYQDRDAVCAMLNERGIDIFGSTTAGEFTSEIVQKGTVSVMLMDMPRDRYEIRFEEASGGDFTACAGRTAAFALETFSNPGFIVSAAGSWTDAEHVVDGIRNVAGDRAFLQGGLAGDDFTKSGAWVFTNGKSTMSGTVTLILDRDRIRVEGICTSGWTPVGTVRTVTRSEGNTVYTIDDVPALDILVKFMGVSDNFDAWADVVVKIGAETPLQIFRPDGSTLNRAPLFANQTDRSVVCAGSVPQGSQIRLTLPPAFEAVENVVAESAALCRRLPEADAIIMFTCQLRNVSLGPFLAEEIKGIRNLWSGSKIAGFFSYGEMGSHQGGNPEFHNNTCSFVAIKAVD